MPTNTLNLVVDAKSGVLYDDLTGRSTVTLNKLTPWSSGYTYDLNLFLVEVDRSGVLQSVSVSTDTELRIGRIARSLQGTGYVTFTFGESVTIPSDEISATRLDRELNGLASMKAAGGIDVTGQGNNFSAIFRTVGDKAALVVTPDLVPTASARVDVIQAGTGSVREKLGIRLVEDSVASVTSWSAIPDASADVSVIQDGAALYHIETIELVGNSAGGSFTYSHTTTANVPININSTADEFQALLSSKTVEKIGAYKWRISWSAAGSVTTGTTDSSGIEQYEGVNGTLSLDNSQLYAVLGGNSEEFTLVVGETGGDPYYSGQVTVSTSVGDVGPGTPSVNVFGDMLASAYDPNTVEGDSFDMDNMVEGSDTKILTAAERVTIAAALDMDNMVEGSDTKILTAAERVNITNAEQTPDSIIEGLAPNRWYSMETDYVTTDTDTGEITNITDRGSDGVDASSSSGLEAYFHESNKAGRSAARMHGSLINGGSGGASTSKTIFAVASMDRHNGARQSVLYVAPLILEWYSNYEMRVWFDPNPGAWVYTNIAQHPKPEQPFIATLFADGTTGYGASFSRGKPILWTNNSGVVGNANVATYLGYGSSAGREMTGEYFEYIEFERTLSEAEMIQVQDALAEKHRLWNYSGAHTTEVSPVELLAHRTGLDDGSPENAISSAQKSSKWADGWEIDTWVNSDGTNWCMHDIDVDRATGGSGNVSSKTDAQMRALVLDGTVSEAPPSLEEFLTAVKIYQKPVMINVKDGAGYTAAGTEVNSSGFDRSLLRTLLPVSNRANWVAEFPEAIHYGMNDTQPTNYAEALAFIDARKAEGLSGFVLEYYQLQPYLIRAGKERGFEWFIHWQYGEPGCRDLGYPGYVDYPKSMIQSP